ncbi:hypothetical protein N9N07_03885 [Pseudomonadales bacterium]|jgi:hypothetical protein|nr:hypothetical protein [Pseudomonadales bacterium]MDA8965361.1 hypothetical protein [Pseudomonadales bacterium]MDB4363492.1 hypothetical protein [Pseudomonadales bacterium]
MRLSYLVSVECEVSNTKSQSATQGTKINTIDHSYIQQGKSYPQRVKNSSPQNSRSSTEKIDLTKTT